MSNREVKGEGGTVASVERALEILNAFEGAPPSLTLAELSTRTGLYKSTLLRLIETLIKYEYLLRQADGSYQIGPRPFLLGARYQSSVIPAEWILPVLRGLTEATGESASFNVRNGDYRVCLLRVDSPHMIRDHTQPGDIRPLGKGAAGKLLLAFARPDDPTYEALRRHPISYSDGEIEPEMAGIGVPVFDVEKHVRGVLTLSGPRSRFTPIKVKQMEQALWQAGMDLTERIGGNKANFTGFPAR